MTAKATARPVDGSEKVLDREPGHLGEMAHRRLAGVALPVGGGEKAYRGVEGEVGRNGVEALRIERQKGLQPLDRIEDQHPGKVEGQQGDRVFERALLAVSDRCPRAYRKRRSSGAMSGVRKLRSPRMILAICSPIGMAARTTSARTSRICSQPTKDKGASPRGSRRFAGERHQRFNVEEAHKTYMRHQRRNALRPGKAQTKRTTVRYPLGSANEALAAPREGQLQGSAVAASLNASEQGN